MLRIKTLSRSFFASSFCCYQSRFCQIALCLRMRVLEGKKANKFQHHPEREYFQGRLNNDLAARGRKERVAFEDFQDPLPSSVRWPKQQQIFSSFNCKQAERLITWEPSFITKWFLQGAFVDAPCFHWAVEFNFHILRKRTFSFNDLFRRYFRFGENQEF